MTRDEVIKELRRVAALLGKTSVSRVEFGRLGNFSASAVERTFGSWNDAVQAAGLVSNTKNERISDRELENEFKRVMNELGGVPSSSQFAANSKISLDVYENRFGRWLKAVERYTGMQAPDRTRTDIEVEPRRTEQPGSPFQPKPESARTDRPAYGPPMNFRGLRHEPLDEQGVVFLFGMVAEELGFLVEAVKASFPDCLAKQAVRDSRGKTLYQTVSIEFEFKSSNFRAHGHDPQKCDLVVCWENDWNDCPVQVLELQSAIKSLSK